jgi:mRNA-degrading endonuclease RelE of RelBE toxin-antitoxin system
MSYRIATIPKFDKQLKKLIKKYPSFKVEFTNFITSLKEDPEQGIPLGNGCYKIRISIASKGKGKSGGARLITNLFISERIIYLISIYDKSEKENLSEKELDDLLKYLPK